MRSSAVFLLDRIGTGMAEKVRTAFNYRKAVHPRQIHRQDHEIKCVLLPPGTG